MDTLPLLIENEIATITINRPAQRNAITLEMWIHFTELCSRLNEESGVRVVIIRGAGEDAFSAGGDISEFPQRRSDPWQATIYNGKVELALKNLQRLRKPTIALIKGYCIGGGFTLAAHCDLRVVADNAHLGFPVGKLGALINYFELERLIPLIGLGATQDLLLTARTVDAIEGKQMGYCTRVFPLRSIDGETLRLAADIINLAPLSQTWHKQMIKAVLTKPDLLDLDPEEAALPDICFDTDDYAEGVNAFLQKRSPIFRGR